MVALTVFAYVFVGALFLTAVIVGTRGGHRRNRRRMDKLIEQLDDLSRKERT